ncbi:DUF445 family protein [Algiphilus sp.]|uniref:DUF445 family protein n=1 Tax=Algiphilus sp. TaxID=1872431 RepID=UPI001CA691DB|nr:DUF445 family protein [Algiphilus sp.]MBY8964829.1 DUF445 family protein [Algiphilus acroporae]MCI5104721.1 DUF445 family protein [Algiphilus sp.]
MLETAWAEFQANLWFYLSMPFVAGAIGYVTNVIAIKMMFNPIEFVGIKEPWLGWQGIVPRKCAKMARIACDTMVPRLITEKEIFQRLNPTEVAKIMGPPDAERLRALVEEIMREHDPELWAVLPERVKKLAINRVRVDNEAVVTRILDGMVEEIDKVFDLKEMVVEALMRDKALINRIFLETGRAEFRFIGHSGFYFGFLFGLFQMVGWVFFKTDWQLPAFGLVVGYLTNFLALKMIFRPQQPKKFGPFTVQGLFHKRQNEVARDYSRLIADEVVNPSNIAEAVLKGPRRDYAANIVARFIRDEVDGQLGVAKPAVRAAMGRGRFEAAQAAAANYTIERLPELIEPIDAYAKEAMNLGETLSTRLASLPSDEFEGMLRPAFQEDEWILIAVGAALGFLVGLGQLVVFKLVAV